MYGMQFVQSMLHPNILHSVKHVTAAGPQHNLWPKHTHHETPYLILRKLKEKYCSFLLKKSYFMFSCGLGNLLLNAIIPGWGRGGIGSSTGESDYGLNYLSSGLYPRVAPTSPLHSKMGWDGLYQLFLSTPHRQWGPGLGGRF